MSPGNWVAIIVGILACFFAGWFCEIARGQRDDERAADDAEDMLKAAPYDSNYRPRVRAGTHP